MIFLKRTNEPRVLLDETPTGNEEEASLFGEVPVNDQTDLNGQILAERRQDMAERKIFADRAYFVTMIWVWFLVIISLAQLIASFWAAGLTNPQFVTVVTTTTASVFGFWLLVGQYLHRAQTTSKRRKNKKGASKIDGSAD